MKELRRLPDTELDVMLVVWGGGTRMDTGEITRRLSDKKPVEVRVVQSYLNRLVEKGYLRCEKIGRLNHYTPLVAMEDYRARETASFVERLYGNSPAKLFAALVQDRGLSPDDLEELRRILEEGDDGKC